MAGMRKLSAEEGEYREYLLNRFFELGYHPRLLSHLRGPTPDDEWARLETIVLSEPDAIDWDGHLKGTGWIDYLPDE